MMRKQNDHTLRIEQVHRHFGGVKAVNAVSADIAPGQFVAIVGPNGAGKTTLFQLISGVERPDAGRVWLGREEITGRTPEHIAALGLARTFQTSRVFPDLTIWDSVLVGSHPALIGGGRYGKRINPLWEIVQQFIPRSAQRQQLAHIEEKAEHILNLFGDRLWPRRFEPAQTLSYANRRRLDIARALMADPLIVLLDEPTAGMNPTETNELASLLQKLHARYPQLTVVMVEHKLHVVRNITERVLVMNNGRLIVDAKPNEALEDERVVQAYLGTKDERRAK